MRLIDANELINYICYEIPPEHWMCPCIIEVSKNMYESIDYVTKQPVVDAIPVSEIGALLSDIVDKYFRTSDEVERQHCIALCSALSTLLAMHEKGILKEKYEGEVK